MKLTELLVESQQLTEKTKPKTSNALSSMVDQLTGKNKSSGAGTTDQATAAPASAPNFSQGGYGQTTVNAPAGLTPQQNLPAAQPAQEPQPAPAQEPQPAPQSDNTNNPGLGQRLGQGAKDFVKGFRQGYSGVDSDAEQQPAAASSTTATNQTAQPATGSAYSQIKTKVDQLDKKGKQRILATLQKELGITPAAPAQQQPAPAAGGQALDLDQFKQQQAQAQAAGQADQQQAIQQMQTTADANAAAAAERSNIEKAGKAAVAKPGFQRTAADNLAIKTAKERGIKIETKKSKKTKKSLKESKGFTLPFSLFKK
jgi:hypothetical protein